MGYPFLVVTKKGTNDLIFEDFASLRRGTEPLRVILTVLWAYNNGIKLQKIPAIRRKTINDGTDISQVHYLIP